MNNLVIYQKEDGTTIPLYRRAATSFPLIPIEIIEQRLKEQGFRFVAEVTLPVELQEKTPYKKGDLVNYKGIIYEVQKDFESSSTLDVERLNGNIREASPTLTQLVKDVSSIQETIEKLLSRNVKQDIVAIPSGKQSDSIQLNAEYNQISSVVTSGDAIRLPKAISGRLIAIRNDGGNSLKLFPDLDDKINTSAVNASISISNNTKRKFICTKLGQWYEF